MDQAEIEYYFIGGMREDYCITHDDEFHLGILGGNAVYAAAGAKLWTSSVGIISRVGSNYPRQWIDQIGKAGINIDGVKVLEDEHNTITFYAYTSQEKRVDINPATHFLRIGQPLPKELFDYESSTEGLDDRDTFGPLAIRPGDLPNEMRSVRGVHLSPAHYLSHSTIPVQLRDGRVSMISLDPSERYMQPGFREELPAIVLGLDAFLPSFSEAQSFFHIREADVWELAEQFGAMGCRFIVIKCGASGQYVWDHDSRKRWHVPAYPARIKDVTGAGDSYCGGFLVGLDQTNDVLEAALRGTVSASITVEGVGPLYLLDAAPGLAQARLDAVRPSVRSV
jgi:sugar/nucleoside kinase (ribokinase family)